MVPRMLPPLKLAPTCRMELAPPRVPKELTSQFQANKLIQEIAPLVGGKGGGRPDNAQGAGKDAAKIDDALARAREILL